MIRDHTAADEARATRAARLALHRAQGDDPDEVIDAAMKEQK